VKGEGTDLTSLDGEVYVDFLGEFTAGIYGHSNPNIAAAVRDALKNGWNYGGPNIYERELARKVSSSSSLLLSRSTSVHLIGAG
jgi:glutamate-1-semialdehyde 2,1-aminomutase